MHVLSLDDIPTEYRPSIEELPGELSRIAYEIEQHRSGQGVELTIFLAQIFRGQEIYFRNIDSLKRGMRDDAIRAEYDKGGITVRRLAAKYGLSQSQIEKTLARPNARK
jgi:Mor family transcriptional regulator